MVHLAKPSLGSSDGSVIDYHRYYYTLKVDCSMKFLSIILC